MPLIDCFTSIRNPISAVTKTPKLWHPAVLRLLPGVDELEYGPSRFTARISSK